MVGGYHVKVQEWITGEERQSTVENVHVEWLTAVQVEENAIVTTMITHGDQTVDIWQTRTHFLLLSWDLVILEIQASQDIIHWEKYDVGVNLAVWKLRHDS